VFIANFIDGFLGVVNWMIFEDEKRLVQLWVFNGNFKRYVLFLENFCRVFEVVRSVKPSSKISCKNALLVVFWSVS
jgi:predicted nucleic acid-binding Zn finger protein